MSNIPSNVPAGGGGSNELMAYARGAKPTKVDREVAAAAVRVRQEVQLRDFTMQAEVAVQTRAAQLACDVIDEARAIAGDDPEKMLIASRFVAHAHNAIEATATGRTNPWGI